MKGVTKIEKGRFMREIDLWNFRLNKLYTEFNRTNNELDIKRKEIDVKNLEFKEADTNLQNAIAETEKQRLQKIDYERSLAGGNEILKNLDSAIELKKAELSKLETRIDIQIEENRAKEEKALRGLKKEQETIQGILSKLNKELSVKPKEIAKLELKSRELENELETKRKELKESNLKLEENQGRIENEDNRITSREAASGEREKQLNFYNKRIQKMATKLNIQLKNI